MSTLLSSKSIDATFGRLASQLDDTFSNADICEQLALNRLRHALARQAELAQLTGEIFPSASADPDVRRAWSAADRDFWRALRYLQRRLDHRARLAQRNANPTAAHATTLFQQDSNPQPIPSQATTTVAAKSTQPAKPTKSNLDAFDVLAPIASNAAFIPMSIVPEKTRLASNPALTRTTAASCG